MSPATGTAGGSRSLRSLASTGRGVVGRAKRTVKSRVHPALLGRVRRLRYRSRIDASALVSVIIPVYDVEPYLRQCLDSVIRQTYRNLEIIIVDDGSPDGSYRIARGYARWDPRITIVRQPNRGLGAARNTGLRHATGDFVTFCDSDDTLPRAAIRTLVATLQRTGSDFAVGNVERVHGDRRWVSQWAQEVHRVDRLGTTLLEAPDVLQDVFAWNKLFRRDFFTRVVGSFPEGIRYEDQEPTAKAYALGRFDVLAAIVYHWRVRDDGTSITQQKANPLDLADRLEVKRRVADVIRRDARPVYRSWLAKAIGFDLRTYYEQVPRTDDAYWEKLRSGVTALAEQLDDPAWTLVPIVDRVCALAVAENSRQSLSTVLVRINEYGWSFPTEVAADGPYLGRDYLADLDVDLPRARLRLGERDLPLVSSLDAIRLVADDTVEVTGRAYICGLDLDRHPTEIRAVLRRGGADGDPANDLPVHLVQGRDPVIDAEANDAYSSYAAARFVATIPLASLPAQAPAPEASEKVPWTWSFVVTVRTAGVLRSGILLNRDARGSANQLPVPAVAPDGRRHLLKVTAREGLTVSAVRPVAVGRDLVVRGTTFSVTVDTASTGAQLTAMSARPALRRVASATPTGSGGTRFTVDLLPGPRTSSGRPVDLTWRLELSQDGATSPVSWAEPSHGRNEVLAADPAAPESGVRATVSNGGNLWLLQSRCWGLVDEVRASADGTELVVGGRLAVRPGWSVGAVLAGSSGQQDGTVELDAEGRFTARLALVENRWDRMVALPTGGRSFQIWAEAPGESYRRWLPVAPVLSATFPRDLVTPLHRLSLSATRRAKALWVTVRAPLPAEDIGRLAQRRLHLQAGADAPLREQVLLETFLGKSAADSPLALYSELRRRRPDLPAYWTVRDHSVSVPEGATPVLLHSATYHRLLRESRHLVNNGNFPFYFRKRPGQSYLQTWHGTPLKRIGNDVPSANLSLSYRELMRREARWWDALLAQNPFSAEVFPRAFDYPGPVLDLGYPRNDVLAGDDAGVVRERTRKLLGVEPDETVVLYAPTWRDNVRSARGYEMVSYLDLRAAVRALGDRCRFLLRGHSNVASSVPLPSTGEVVDVTAYPDINDLFLAADVLITDYSSVMFDFCTTGKPMLFLTPDLKQYRGKTRGFYFDFEAEAPGPVLMDTAACLAALSDLAALRLRYEDRYRRFAQRYAPRDDGRAAGRVVDVLWPDVVTDTIPGTIPGTIPDTIPDTITGQG